MFETYESTNQFREKFNRQLSLTIQRDFSNMFNGQHPNTTDTLTPLSVNAQSLLLAASKDLGGQIIRVRSFDGLSVTTNGKEYVDRGNSRSEASWDATVDELIESRFIQARGISGDILRVTQSGYEMANTLESDK